MLVVYVSPFLRKDVYLFLDRLSRIEGVQVGLVSTLDDESLSPQVFSSIAGYRQRLADNAAAIERLVSRDLDLQGKGV